MDFGLVVSFVATGLLLLQLIGFVCMHFCCYFRIFVCLYGFLVVGLYCFGHNFCDDWPVGLFGCLSYL